MTVFKMCALLYRIVGFCVGLGLVVVFLKNMIHILVFG